MTRVDSAALRQALFAPRSVALVGASADDSKTTARPLRYLQRHGFAGRIVPINPGRAEIAGLPAFPSLLEAPDGIEHAFIMCRAQDVRDTVRQCGERGIACATILSDGFAEAGPEGEERQRLVAEEARRQGVRLVGPNSIGIVDTSGFACSANAALDIEALPRGKYAVVSQSGSMIGALISQGAARSIGFSSLVSIGNEIDLTVGEIGSLLLEDDRCEAILLFLESIKDREALARFAWSAHAHGKPVIAYKLGRSEAGRELAATHTGALAGGDDVVDALFSHLGIARVAILESLIEAGPLFLGTLPATGRRVGVITTTGGGGAMVVDCLGALGVEIASAPASVLGILREAGICGGANGLIDLTLVGTRPELVRAVIEAMMGCGHIDAVAMVIGSSAQFHSDLAVAPLLGFAGSPKPLAVYLVPAAEESRLRLAQDNIAAPSDTLDEVRARAVFDALGIPGPAGTLVQDRGACAEAFTRLGGRAVAKIVSPDILHKSDHGGVVLGIETPAAALDAFDALMRNAGAAYSQARIEGVLLQRMENGVAEALVGFQRDPALGPVVLLGAGGVFAELYRDTTVRVAPVDRATAQTMIDEVVGLSVARGFRGRPLGDLEALADAIVAVSRLADCPSVAQAEINPLLVKTGKAGVTALDALIIRQDLAHVRLT